MDDTIYFDPRLLNLPLHRLRAIASYEALAAADYLMCHVETQDFMALINTDDAGYLDMCYNSKVKIVKPYPTYE